MKKLRFKKDAFIFELLIGFLLLDLMNYFLFPYDLGFKETLLHPYWIMILLLSCRWGFIAGILGGAVAAAHYIFFTLHGIPSRSQLEQWIELQGFTYPIAFILVGMILGNIRQRHIVLEAERSRLLAQREKEIKSSKKQIELSETSKRVLETRIVGQTTTVKTLYEAARALETLNFENVYKGCLDILTKHFQVHKASVYIREGDYYVLKAAYGWGEGSAVEGKIHRDKSLMQIVFKENRPITVKDILKKEDSQKYAHLYGQALAMFPIQDEKGRPIGVVNIEKMDFLSLNKSNLQIIGLMVEWVSQALNKILLLKSMDAQLIYDEEYQIYNYHHFKDVLESEFARAKRHGLSLTVSLVKLEQFGFLKEQAQKIFSKMVVTLLKKFMMETGMIFKYRFDGTFVVISPMQTKEGLRKQFNKLTSALKNLSMEEISLTTPQITISSQQIQEDMSDPSEMIAPALKECGVE